MICLPEYPVGDAFHGLENIPWAELLPDGLETYGAGDGWSDQDDDDHHEQAYDGIPDHVDGRMYLVFVAS